MYCSNNSLLDLPVALDAFSRMLACIKQGLATQDYKAKEKLLQFILVQGAYHSRLTESD